MAKENTEAVPTLQEWRPLYEAATKFRQTAAWNWMWDSDIFGVENPLNGETGYCCVLGKNGEFFGLAVYLGIEGLEGYLKMQDGTISKKEDDILHHNKCLLASFKDRNHLQKPDLEIIKELALKFRGSFSWPLFRSYRPGYFPWYLTKEEAVFLTLCLGQSTEIASRFKENPRLFASPDDKGFFVRIRHDNLVWNDSWCKPTVLRKIVTMTKTIDLQQIENILHKGKRTNQAWEVDFFYAPAYIAEKGKRPYFPVVFLFVDSYSFFIFNSHISPPDRYSVEFLDQFLKTIENSKLIPAEIRARRDELSAYLGPIAEHLGFKVRLMKKLEALDDARKGMFEYFGRRKHSERKRSS